MTFSVANGTALVAATTNDIPATFLTLRTDTNGKVSAWVYFPPDNSSPPDSTILAAAPSGTNAITVTVNEFVPRGHWTFNDTNTWVGEAGQLPLLTNNLVGIPSWSGNAVLVDSSSPALLAYNTVETNGQTNIDCQVGSVLFWFKPDWSSANMGGSGPGVLGRLIEMGNHNPDFAEGWWALYLSSDGTQLSFGTSANGIGMTNLTARISWYSNEWYQIALTYSPTGSALYVDGQLLANGTGVTHFPNAGELTNGFRIGSDGNGNNQARGAFDELETFGYPLAAANTATYSSEIPDWWEVKYFGRAGFDPGSGPSGVNLWWEYQFGRDPNVIDFVLSATGRYVNNNTVPVQINVLGGEPAFMTVVANTNNLVVMPDHQFDIDSNFTNVTWQPYQANVVAVLNSGDGNYNVWIGLRGIAPDGQITWQGTRITLDTVPPVLTIIDPTTGVVSQPAIQLQGCANELISSLTYDVSNAAGIWTNQAGYVTAQFCDTNLQAITTNWFQCYNVALSSNGVNLITLHATDPAGNTTTTNIGFTLEISTDTTPPVLAVIWPPDGAQISGSSFTLRAQVDDPMSTVSASIVDANGDTNTVQGLIEQSGLVWVKNLPLTNGANTLTVTATDAAGNASVTNLTLFQSSVSMTINALTHELLNQSSVSVSGTVSDVNCTITVNGMTATVNPNGTWTADQVPVSSSGTAIFDVAAYSEGVNGNVRRTAEKPSGNSGGGKVRANDDRDSNPAIVSSFDLQPVKVGLMSYLSNVSGQGHDSEAGEFVLMGYGTCPFWNAADLVNWTYQSGGSDWGYDFYSGAWNWYYMLQAPHAWFWNDPLPAGKDAYSAPWENTSASGQSGNSVAEKNMQARVMIEPQGQIAAGTVATYLVRAQAWDVISGRPLPPDLLQIQGVTLMPMTDADGTVRGARLLTASAGAMPEVTPMTLGSYSFDVKADEMNLQLAVDANRDGDISFDQPGQTNPDQTTAAKPYRFWINDSKESGDDESSGGADDQIPGQPSFGEDDNRNPIPYANYAHNQIQGRSDLVNLFPVALCLSNVLQWLPPTNGYEYHLVQGDSAIKFVYTSLTPANAFDYLTNTASTGYGTNFNEYAMSADTIQVPNILPASCWTPTGWRKSKPTAAWG